MSTNTAVRHLTLAELEAGLAHIRQAPRDQGMLAMIVRRPAVNEREVLTTAELDPAQGLVGDNWRVRGSTRTADGSAHPDMQLNIMNARAIALLAQDEARWPLAGDQLYIDLDLSAENLPPGTQLQIGSAIIEVTAQPHTGCQKFMARFGADALKFVNSAVGRELHLRGINAKVVQGGVIRAGDRVSKLHTTPA
ncbi:MAG TPA: MOSC domain-containing protein [Chloroflexi bacterium]|nr:MOSC domain-containing protein [Chloroflexota bacterium]